MSTRLASRVACLMGVLALAVACQPAPRPKQMTIEMTGSDFHWQTRYPGPDQTLGTPDDIFGGREVHLPAGIGVEIQLRSEDYIYMLVLPHLDLREIAVPDLEFSLRFAAGPPGEYELRGNQMCGDLHPSLLGTLTVESWEDFDAWLSAQGR